MKDIGLDIEYFGRSYNKAKIKKNIDGKNAFLVADELRDLLFAYERLVSVKLWYQIIVTGDSIGFE